MKTRNPQHGQPVKVINPLPIAIIAGRLLCWISGCNKMSELITCEGLLKTWIRDRYPGEVANRYIPELIGIAQVKHVELQLAAMVDESKSDRSC